MAVPTGLGALSHQHIGADLQGSLGLGPVLDLADQPRSGGLDGVSETAGSLNDSITATGSYCSARSSSCGWRAKDQVMNPQPTGAPAARSNCRANQSRSP